MIPLKLDLFQSETPISKVLLQTKPTFTCSKLTIEALEQGVEHVQS